MAGQYFVYKFNLLRMKTRHLFTVALAAFAFAACSQDDDINTNPEPQPGEKGALVEGISINFGESNSSKTRVASGTQKGEGSEGMIYEAYIFAKEANPTHPRSLVGDWTVLRVTADQTSGAMVVETGGVDTEKTLKEGLKKAINENSKADVEWLVKDVASFHGVRQGDYVYVIANDPNLTLAQAAVLAHNGEKSEENIKGYVASINKDYLNGLVYPGDAKDEKGNKTLPTGKLIMAGREMIPVSPNIPSNGTFSMTIGLDRELSKVNFSASISTNDADVAKGKVAFLEDDGIVVARIARKASPFAEMTADWYVPGNNCVEDWPVNDHALVNNKYTSFCDGTFEGSFVFDGTADAPITDWNKGVTIPAGFNGVAPASSVTEYRYSWKLKTGAELTKNSNLVYLSGDKGTIYAPVFYTTPNYSNNTNSVTVICTQATYVDRGVFKNSNMIDTYVDAALNETEETIEIFTADETSGDPLSVKNPLKWEAESATSLTKSDILAKVKVAVKNWGIKMFDKSEAFDAAADALPAADKAIWEATAKPDFAAYQKMMDRFYVAVLLQQRLANKGDKEVGTSTASADKMNWGNGIKSGKDGYYTNTDTDSLLVGYKKLDDGNLVNNRFYFYVDMPEASVEGMIANAMFMPTSVVAGVKSGAEVRAAYFADIDSYQYIKGQKLYYRADIADYVGGASNKLTERNMYYVSRGTIQSLGAKSIHDAIYSDQNTMHIDVKVNDWKLSINEIPM